MQTIWANNIPLNAVLNTVMDGIITIDEAGHIRSFNRAAEHIFGYQPDEVLGRNVNMLLPEPYQRPIDGHHHGREVAGKRKDGATFPIELGLNEMKIDGNLLFVGHVRDISERREQEEKIQQYVSALARSEERYKLAIEVLSVGIWDWVIPTNKLFWSRRFKEIICVARTPKDRFRDWEDRLHPEDRSRTLEMLHGHLAQLNPYDIEYRLRRDDGGYVWVHARGQAVWDENGAPQRMSGSVEDITQRRAAEAAIQSYVEKLTRSNQELDDFAYIASHDLKEPIRGVSNNALFILEDYGETLDDTVQKRLQRMTHLCQRMEALVDDLLYFSRLGRQDLAVQQIDLNTVVSDIELMMENTLQEHHARIVLPYKLPVIVCDVPRVTEVFRNLITNAVKYNQRAEKIIEIGVSAEGNPEVPVFYVKDNGIGIEAQFHDDIFRMFKRLNEEDENVKGSGVGLTFVKKIIGRHGGRIWLESESGIGTTFFFTLASQEKPSA